MPKLDLDAVPQINATGYPMPFAAEMGKRHYRRLAPAGGLSDLGVSHVVLEPGGVSSQRHWHEGIDEFVVMLAGEAVLVEDEAETVMRPGDCAVFPKDVPNGHRLVNRSDADCAFLAFDSGTEGDCHYPDIDLRYNHQTGDYTHLDGSAY